MHARMRARAHMYVRTQARSHARMQVIQVNGRDFSNPALDAEGTGTPRHMRADMCADVCADVCADMRTDICQGSMRTDICQGMCHNTVGKLSSRRL